MTERPFEALGLSADADRAYPLLVATRGVAAGELARQMGVPTERAESACGELAARDLVRLGGDGRWYPAPPQSGLLPLVSRAQEQLRLGRELLDRLGVEYQRVHEGYRAEEIVHVVEGHTAIRQWVGQVHDAATTELAAFVRAPGDLAGDGGDPFACAGVPGPRVRRRLVFERAGIEASGVGRGIDPAARVADKLPVRLCLVDRSLALLPLAADARPPDPVMLVIRPSGLLDALVTLFESVWASSVPLGRRDVEHPHTALQLRVLAMLVSGSTDTAMARSLGVAVRTVQRHIAAMQRDAGVDNRVQLVWYAARHRWLDDDSGAQEVVPSAWREPDAG